MPAIGLAYCAHCGNNVQHELVGAGLGKTDVQARKQHYHLVRCTTCQDVMLYRRMIQTAAPPSDALDFKNAQQLWPEPGLLHPCVPTSVQKCYQEASLIKSRSPNGFANQIRRALEAVCKDRGATHHVLHENLKELVKKGEIPPTLAEMTDVIRMLGNIGSHAGDDEIQPEYVDVLDEFFFAVVEYVYVAPAKVAEIKAKLENAKKPK